MVQKALALWVLLLIMIWPSEAVGGLFPATGREYIDLRSLDITYAIDSKTETITAYFQAQYAGVNPEFLWLIPVPTDEVETEYLGGYASLDLTYHNSPVIFDLPPNYCANMHSDLYSSGSGGSDLPYVSPEVVQTQVLSSDKVLRWLDEGNYDIPSQVRSRVEEYTVQGMYFVALELEDPVESSWLTSIALKLSYPAGDISRLTVPFGLFFNDEPVDVEMSILADVRYVPENFADVTVDRHEFRVDHAIGWVRDIPIRMNAARAYFSSRSNYLDLRHETIRRENGLAFITELAMPIDLLYEEMNKPYGESSLVEIRYNLSDYATRVGRNISDYHYLTQLFGLAGYADNPDPVFVASSADSVVGNVIDATDVDPLAVWGCSTRTIENTGYEAIEPYLPSGRTSFYAHPEGWESYPIEYGEGDDRRRGMIIAPKPVNYQTLEAYWNGEPTPPMLLIASIHHYPIGRDYSTYNFKFPDGAVLPRYGRNLPVFAPAYGGSGGIIIGLLTTEDDFAENEAMYRAMVDFPLTYQYRIHPELRHSLYLNPTQGSLYFPPSIIPAFSIGFPEGWIERMPIPQHVFIVPDPWNTPETFEGPSDVPYVWIRPVDDFDENIPTGRWEERISAAADYMVERFGVDRDDLITIQSTACDNRDIFQAFEQDGRRGYVAISLPIREHPFLIEISAPIELYEQYQTEIENILASAYPHHLCG